MKYFYLITLCLLGLNSLFAQELMRSTLSAAGSSESFEIDGSLFIVQQSIGQPAIIGTVSSENIILRQGFIQPPIRILSTNNFYDDLDAIVYPNPFSNIINVHFRKAIKGSLSILIYDMLGRIVYEQNVKAEQNIYLNLEFLSSAEYILLISSGTRSFTANILKN